VEYLRRHGQEHNLDISRLVIAGGSGGAVFGSVMAQLVPECVAFVGFDSGYGTLIHASISGLSLRVTTSNKNDLRYEKGASIKFSQ
jgi:hypothetical protein